MTEGEDNFELGVRFFIEIGQKLVQTTLLDPLHASLRFEGLIKACKVRCFPFVHIRNAFLLKSGDKLIPAVPETDKKKRGVDFDLWLGYHYQGRGGEHLKRIGGKQFQLPPLEPLETGEQVRKWLATGIPDDPNEIVEQMREDLRKAAEFGNSSSDNPKDPCKLHSIFAKSKTLKPSTNYPISAQEPLLILIIKTLQTLFQKKTN